MTPNTISALEPMGYKVGIAQGSVQVEQDALTTAREAADPTLIQEQANTVVADTVTALTKLDRIPKDESERLQMFADMGELAYKTITEASTERVAFHERALAIAQASADVWAVRQLVGPAPAEGEPDTRPVVLTTYVSCKADGTGWTDDDQAHLDALADADGYAEREYQGLNPDAMQAASTLAALGRDVSRPSAGADVFEVDGATHSGADLLVLAEKAAAEPPPLTPVQNVVAVLDAAPEISDATKQALRDALA